MSTIYPFNVVAHFNGTGTTVSPTTLNTGSGYIAHAGSGTDLSYVQWKPFKQTAAATQRYMRAQKTQFFVFIISLRPTTTNWQDRLLSVEIGYTKFRRPTHFHCITDPTQSLYSNRHVSTNPQVEIIWPTNVFTSWGAVYVGVDKDWLPPVVVTSASTSSTDRVDFAASMTLLRMDFRGFILNNESTAYDLTTITNNVPSGTPFPFSRHESLPPGLYWRWAAFNGTNASGASRWSAVPGSDVTGYTAPAEEPSCPFVVKTGTI